MGGTSRSGRGLIVSQKKRHEEKKFGWLERWLVLIDRICGGVVALQPHLLPGRKPSRSGGRDWVDLRQ